MSSDFTHDTYASLLDALRERDFRPAAIHDALRPADGDRRVFLRHDVDRLPGRALKMARLEAARGVAATYYFRTKRTSFRPAVISAIVALGHHVGYHYENLADAHGDVDAAWADFQAQLRRFEPWKPIRTVAMHGRPFSRWDTRTIWSVYDYRVLGIDVEPYYDMNWSRTMYLTDTGRAWDSTANLRDRPPASLPLPRRVSTTGDVIAILRDVDGDIMLTVHPERWTGHPLGWLQVWVTDKAINAAKRAARRSRRGAGAAAPPVLR